ncbi:MAG: ABC transporter ATP-binding protein [Planctomycetota bacterium]|nr:ABC transporter ATP-binding protein [Planctomycetota bacterium]
MIRVERLTCAAGKFKLDDITLAVAPGEYFAILGPTGCGKTTLLECICGLRTITDGQIVVDGRDVTGESPERRGFGYVPQDYVLLPFLTVSENILFPLRVQKKLDADAKAHFSALVDILRIGPLLDRKPHHLSGGERQRSALARALVTRPRLLLLDEPYASVDMGLRKKLWAEMKSVHSRFHTTVVHVTHDLDEALALSQRAAVLVNGCLAQVGRMEEILERPATRDVAEFTGMTNIYKGQVAGMDESGKTMTIRWHGWTLRAPLPNGLNLGAEVEFYLRPDRIEPLTSSVKEGARRASVISGRFSSAVVHRGGRTFFFRVPNGTDTGNRNTEALEVSLSTECVFAPEEGESVLLDVPEEAVGIFPRPSTV